MAGSSPSLPTACERDLEVGAENVTATVKTVVDDLRRAAGGDIRHRVKLGVPFKWRRGHV